MRPAGKLGAYGVVLALALAAGAAIGNAVGPIDTTGGHGDAVEVPAGDPAARDGDTTGGHGTVHEEG